MTEAYARIREQRAKTKKKFEREQAAERAGPVGKFFSGIVGALDFQEDIASDRGILASFRNNRKGEKMTGQQEGALKRKIIGTKAGFFGDTVDLKGKYADSGYVSSKPSEGVPYLPFLVLVVLGVCAATVVVVSKAG